MLNPFDPADLHQIIPQSSQKLDDEGRTRILEQTVPRGPCWTARNGQGMIIGLGGFAFVHSGWATAWTILAESIGPAMPGLTRAVGEQLKNIEARRVDMHVDPSELSSARWAQLLGFRLEAFLADALPDGRGIGVWLYERMGNG